jgi:protein required for attachment to host cells
MKNRIKIPRKALVLVADGRKALLLRNVGNAVSPNLQIERVLQSTNPPTHRRVTDRPGRRFARARTNRRGVEPTDWRALTERRFIRLLATAMQELVEADEADMIVVSAPPRALAKLQRSLTPAVKRRIVAQLDNDLVKHPVVEIGKHLTQLI